MDFKDQTALLQRRIQELEVFNQIGKTLTSTLDIGQVLATVMDHITHLLKPTNWSMLLVDPVAQDLYFEIVVGEEAEKIRDIRMKIGEGICGWVAKERKPLLIADVNQDPRFSKKVDKASQFKTEAIVCVPMISKNKVLGVIELINKKEGGGEFTQDNLKLLETLADYAAIAFENANNYKEIHKLTIRDDLTGLYNSRYMHQFLEEQTTMAQSEGSAFSLIFLDLDHFKNINDSHGHLVGSHLLHEVANLVAQVLPPKGVGTRYGGDEFVLLLPQTDKDGALKIAQNLRQLINENTFLQDKGLAIRLTASFGLASFPTDANTKEELIQMADQAMYRVKESTRNDIQVA